MLFFPEKVLMLFDVLFSGPKYQKVPVNKMVRTDSSDPAGRLHAYLKAKPPSHSETLTRLASVR